MSYNRLAEETSPYLLQHKDNPVHWWPWGEAAFAEARRQNKPVLLSVGYAACHWCHVMAHESFEDAGTAALMNALYVNVKVDREERPDVDALYMAALHELGEPGGWPLTMFLTPEGEPFWGGTYFPKEPAYGRSSFAHVLHEIARIFREEGEKVTTNAQALRSALNPRNRTASTETVTEPMLADFAARLAQAIDPVNGGLGGAPKFPNAVIMGFLWKLGLRNGLPACTEGVERSLVHMCQGGIYDHLGGGFARYSVDERWLVPHFEKMLYDNALLVDLMTEVWKETGSPLLETRIGETVAWLLREMTAPEGGFASSYDADSEGEEGRFYVWSREEILSAVGEEEGSYFCSIYDVTAEGNWEGVNILNRLRDPALALTGEEEERLARSRAKLLEVRSRRVSPGWDDKVLADWNGLAIAALVNAAQTFREQAWLDAARSAYRFIRERMTQDGRLFHSYRAGKAHNPGVASDYANMIAAAIRIHLATGDAEALADARMWIAIMDRHYWAEPGGGYYLSADDTGDILIRTLSARDDAVPNANPVMMSTLSALHLLTGELSYQSRALALMQAFLGDALHMPSTHTGFLAAVPDVNEPRHLVLIRGEDAERVADELRRISLPGTLVHWLDADQDAPLNSPAYGKQALHGRTTAYFCIGPQCSPPVTGAAEIAAALRGMHGAAQA